MNRKIKSSGFTLVEMLTTIAIIAVMIGLLIPALSMVQKTAGNVRQKGQFYSIGTALEAFRSDMGDYPDSSYGLIAGSEYSGAQKLAEALIGQDGFGFHPKSLFRPDGLADMDSDGTIDDAVYHIGVDEVYETADQNLKARKGPYLEIENANAVQLENIYSDLAGWNGKNYIIADKYGLVKNAATGKKTGMPVLYFKANTTKWKHEPADMADMANCVYNLRDNLAGFISKNAPLESPVPHPLVGDFRIFYNAIKNPNFAVAGQERPYRANSFILLSAGIDGLYGTPDDIYNFSEGDK